MKFHSGCHESGDFLVKVNGILRHNYLPSWEAERHDQAREGHTAGSATLWKINISDTVVISVSNYIGIIWYQSHLYQIMYVH